MAASNLLYSCPLFRVNRVFLNYLGAKSLYLYYQLKKKLLADQDLWCREENFIVFKYVLRSIVTPWSGLRNSRDKNHAHIYFVIFPWLALYVALVYLIHRWTMLEKMRKTLFEAILVAISNGHCLRMRKAGSCKAQILETRVDFVETRSELFQKQVR